MSEVLHVIRCTTLFHRPQHRTPSVSPNLSQHRLTDQWCELLLMRTAWKPTPSLFLCFFLSLSETPARPPNRRVGRDDQAAPRIYLPRKAVDNYVPIKPKPGIPATPHRSSQNRGQGGSHSAAAHWITSMERAGRAGRAGGRWMGGETSDHKHGEGRGETIRSQSRENGGRGGRDRQW